ncbi:MAG: hypothetical protein ACE1Z7_05540, partial [Woeseiaceae bacterium]
KAKPAERRDAKSRVLASSDKSWKTPPKDSRVTGLPQAPGGRSIGSRDRKTYIEPVSATVEWTA